MSLPNDLYQIVHNPMSGRGYAFWSGIGSGSPILAGVFVFLRKHNCHVKGCPRIQFKAHPDDPSHLVCRRHHKESECPSSPSSSSS